MDNKRFECSNTEEDYKTKFVSCGNQAGGNLHTYRFDWHTGSDTETPRVEYYFDDELIHTAYEYISTNESRFWLGLWFPKYCAGTPEFETTEFVFCDSGNEVEFSRSSGF